MDNALEKVLQLLGLGTPFLYAAAAFVCFHYLDKKASAQAKVAIATWFKAIAASQNDVSSALVEVFDRIYTQPLLGWRALRRSAIISTTLSIIYYVHLFGFKVHRG